MVIAIPQRDSSRGDYQRLPSSLTTARVHREPSVPPGALFRTVPPWESLYRSSRFAAAATTTSTSARAAGTALCASATTVSPPRTARPACAVEPDTSRRTPYRVSVAHARAAARIRFGSTERLGDSSAGSNRVGDALRHRSIRRLRKGVTYRGRARDTRKRPDPTRPRVPADPLAPRSPPTAFSVLVRSAPFRSQG